MKVHIIIMEVIAGHARLSCWEQGRNPTDHVAVFKDTIISVFLPRAVPQPEVVLALNHTILNECGPGTYTLFGLL